MPEIRRSAVFLHLRLPVHSNPIYVLSGLKLRGPPQFSIRCPKRSRSVDIQPLAGDPAAVHWHDEPGAPGLPDLWHYDRRHHHVLQQSGMAAGLFNPIHLTINSTLSPVDLRHEKKTYILQLKEHSLGKTIFCSRFYHISVVKAKLTYLRQKFNVPN